MIDTISSLRAYALKHARALRVLRSVKSQGQADAYQDMGHRLSELEKHTDEREKLVQSVIRLFRDWTEAQAKGSPFADGIDHGLTLAIRKLAEWKP